MVQPRPKNCKLRPPICRVCHNIHLQPNEVCSWLQYRYKYKMPKPLIPSTYKIK